MLKHFVGMESMHVPIRVNLSRQPGGRTVIYIYDYERKALLPIAQFVAHLRKKSVGVEGFIFIALLKIVRNATFLPLLKMEESDHDAPAVARICNLLYRRIAFGRRIVISVRRKFSRDAAYKSAIRQIENLRYS